MNSSAIYQSFLSLIAIPPTKFGDFGLARTKYLASLVWNPQNTYLVIHIAGTSGKWSTATCTAAILQAHGYKTGLHVSPHLLDRRERVQVDNIFVSDDILVQAAEKLFPAIELCRNSQYGQPSYYESMVVFVYLCFSLAHVDVAVVEVGCGGLYDGSNIITKQDKISIITRQGYDHQDIVGDTLQEISYNDAGIILPNSRVVALAQDEDICNQTIQTYADEQKATISWVSWDIFRNIRLEVNQTIFDYDDQKDISLWLIGLFQSENAALAITATQLFCTDFDREKTRSAVEKTGFIGRFDIRSLYNRTLILDGAHNPQKMQALVDTLRVLYPDKKIIRYTAFKQGKDRQEMLDVMQTLSQDFILWAFVGTQDMSFRSVSQEDIVKYLDWVIVECNPNPSDFFANIEAFIPEDTIIVVTWSLYRLSKVYIDSLT